MSSSKTVSKTSAQPELRTPEQRQMDETLELLDRLAEGRFDTEEVKIGDQWMIPEMYEGDLIGAAHKLIEIEESMQQAQRFTKVLPYKKWDVLVAITSVFKKRFGMKVQQLNTFFETGTFKDIPVSITETANVPFGTIKLPLFKGTMRVFSTTELPEDMEEARLSSDVEGAVILIDSPKKNEPRILALWTLIEQELAEHSIYRGKAIDGSSEIPTFLDLRKFDPKTVIYTETTERQLEANLWAPIRHPEITKQMGIHPARKVLLSGAFGTGKTLTAKSTAKLCEETDRTFIICNPKSQDVFSCLKMAVQYSKPNGAVLFVEDIDRLTSDVDKNEIARLLDELDGFQSKGYNVMMVFTTNRVEQIHKGVLRPGRLDSVITIAEFDEKATTRLFKLVFKDDQNPKLLKGVDFKKLYEEMEGFTPAFTMEVCQKAKLYAVPKLAKGQEEHYTTEDFLAVILEVRAQHDLHKTAPDVKAQGNIDTHVEAIVKESVNDALGHARVVDRNLDMNAKVLTGKK